MSIFFTAISFLAAGFSISQLTDATLDGDGLRMLWWAIGVVTFVFIGVGFMFS